MLGTYFPSDSTIGQSVIKDIIPVISWMRQNQRVQFTTMFTTQFLAAQGLPAVIEISDLKSSDLLFDGNTFK